jgi:fatty acid desaturase
MNTPPTARKAPQSFKKSAVAGWLTFFAVLDFIAAGLGLLLVFSNNAAENRVGWVLLPIGLSSGFVALAFAKIVNCLHESTYRLQNIEKLLEHQCDIAIRNV